MSCHWCEEPGNLVSLCEIDGHDICVICYGKYHRQYPRRVKGCPYCKGIEEISIIIDSSRSDDSHEETYDRVQESHSLRHTTQCCCFCMCLVIFLILFVIFHPVMDHLYIHR